MIPIIKRERKPKRQKEVINKFLLKTKSAPIIIDMI